MIMISAFGVEHTVSKSWTKMGPKLARAGSFVAKPTDDIGQRMKVNYSQWRHKSGWLGKHEVNPRKFDKGDADWHAYSGKRPDERTLAVRAKGMARSKEKAVNLKEGSRAAVAGYSAQARRKRVLP